MNRVLFAAVMSVSAVAVADPSDVSLPTSRGVNSCATPQVPAVASDGFARYLLAPGVQRVVYLNRFGGQYNIGTDPTDGAHNSARAASMQIQARGMVNIAPLSTAFDWSVIAPCVKAHYAKINVRFVEVEPTSGPYVEAVIGGNGSELGFGASSGILGIASNDTFCSVGETGIAFNFSESHVGIPQRNQELCATIAHEVGHVLALEHETLATDLMSYVPISESSTKAFVDQGASCGTYPGQPTNCSCNSSQQNSFNRLTTYVGARPVESNKPSLSVSSPGGGSTVPPAFNVVASASDGEGMADVRVLVDGVESGVSSAPSDGRYTVLVHGVAEGDHQVTVIARDLAGNEASQMLSLKVAKAQLGDSCVSNEACAGNLCATGEDGNFCTQTCDVANDTCPSDFECQDIGGASICVVTGGCGCSTSDPRDAVGALLVLGFGLVLSRRKRR